MHCWASRLRFSSGCFAAVLLLLGGCASIERSRLDRGMERLRADVLETANSREQLVALAASHGALLAQREEYRLDLLCSRPEWSERWVCRGHRHGRDKENEGTLDRIEVTGSRIVAEDVITNNQEAGVDEGDIVKKLGDRLYLLRQGRLHTIAIGSEDAPELTHVDTLVVATDDSGLATWYDEILAAGDLLILLGYNWSEEHTELSVFEVHAGGLRHSARYRLRSDDYFSGNNYGSRIEGEHLLVTLTMSLEDAGTRWPEWAAWSGDPSGAPVWHSLVEPDSIHLPLVGMPVRPSVHVLARCALASLPTGSMDCQATGVIGSSQSEFYASAQAAYLAISEWDEAAWLEPEFDPLEALWRDQSAHWRRYQRTVVYRMPFRDIGAVQVGQLVGALGDQFSLKEDGHGLLAATRDSSKSPPEVVLHRLDWNLFSDRLEAPATEIARIGVSNAHRTMRFGQGALWVGEDHWYLQEGDDEESTLVRIPVDGGAVGSRRLAHSADLIEPLGGDVLVSGSAGRDWVLSLVGEEEELPLRGSLWPPGQAVSENRSHAFNARRTPSGWLFGMPVVSRDGRNPWDQVSDIALFTTVPHLAQLARIDMQQRVACDEHCYDFYGDARLFFVGERLFALSGGLLKELAVKNGVVHEVGALAVDHPE